MDEFWYWLIGVIGVLVFAAIVAVGCVWSNESNNQVRIHHDTTCMALPAPERLACLGR